MEVSRIWFGYIRESILNDKGAPGGTSLEECAKKAFLLYIQSWLSRGEVNKMSRTTKGESEEIKDRKSYMVKIKEMVFGLMKCELYPMISGYREVRTWHDDKMIFIIHGNPGCDIWFRRFVDLSKTGRIWELNEEGEQVK